MFRQITSAEDPGDCGTDDDLLPDFLGRAGSAMIGPGSPSAEGFLFFLTIARKPEGQMSDGVAMRQPEDGQVMLATGDKKYQQITSSRYRFKSLSQLTLQMDSTLAGPNL